MSMLISAVLQLAAAALMLPQLMGGCMCYSAESTTDWVAETGAGVELHVVGKKVPAPITYGVGFYSRSCRTRRRSSQLLLFKSGLRTKPSLLVFSACSSTTASLGYYKFSCCALE
jgi:hypothetical protein